jgi:hypothetical protein
MNIGDHLVSPRTGYTHHGIYIGNNQVIHYSGFADGLSSGEIEIASLETFKNGNSFSVSEYLFRTYDGDDSVSRAYSRLGEDWYNVLINNCEQFVTWCIMGIHSSSQVNNLISAVVLSNKAMSLRAVPSLICDSQIPIIGSVLGQATPQLASSAVSVAAKSVLSSSAASVTSSVLGTTAGAASGAALVSSVGGGIATGIGTAAGVTGVAAAAGPIAVVAVVAGVGYGVKKLFDWISD